jgi:2-keto-4-pentenoate hydratase/2-oxohepta-3-ene-1,7-dioic acid hydratase in catechol pathway
MKLINYTTGNEARMGAVVGETVLDLSGLGLPDNMLAFIQSGPETWAQAVRHIQSGNLTRIPLNSARLMVPLPNPPKIVSIGLNYMDHCREQNIPVPERPLVFAKFPSSVIGPSEAIRWDPELTQQVDYEAELGVVIGRQAYRVELDKALDYVFGYTIVNDISARDLQFSDGQWVRGKSLDTFCPVGPALVTADEIPDPQSLKIRCRINGQLLQDSSTSEMIFSVRELIAYLSRSFTLQPGDLITTGTPDGVGVFRQPQIFLKQGDLVEAEIEGLGCLENPVDLHPVPPEQNR